MDGVKFELNYIISLYTKKMYREKIENSKHLKTSQNIFKILSKVEIRKINLWCKFQVSTDIRF